MPLLGTLSTMPLPDLLRWLGAARRTGTLRIERNSVVKWIVFREGRVVGCSSDDPPERLGQFLLSRGRITEDQLREGLRIQESGQKHLGMILVEMGALSEEDLEKHLAAKSEETIYSIFDWDNAVFRFEDGRVEVRHVMPVRLNVDDILLRGLERHDEMRRIREVFDEPAQVLRQTPRMPPPEVFHNRMARKIYEAIDGQRTVADILLIARGSEYLVKKFLHELHRNGYVVIAGTRQSPPPPPARPTSPSRASRPAAPARAGATAGAAVLSPPAPEPAAAPRGLQAELGAAHEMMRKGDHDAALRILDAVCKQHPHDEALRRLMAEAEVAFIEKAYRHYLPAHKTPVLTRPMESLESESFSPEEVFLLSRIDGTWDVKSIIQITPLRELEALRALKAMRERGLIDLRDPD